MTLIWTITALLLLGIGSVTVKLVPAEWNVLVQAIKAGELNEL